MNKNTVNLVVSLGLMGLIGLEGTRSIRVPGQQTSNRPCDTRGKPKAVRVRRKANKLASANRKLNRRKE